MKLTSSPEQPEGPDQANWLEGESTLTAVGRGVGEGVGTGVAPGVRPGTWVGVAIGRPVGAGTGIDVGAEFDLMIFVTAGKKVGDGIGAAVGPSVGEAGSPETLGVGNGEGNATVVVVGRKAGGGVCPNGGAIVAVDGSAKVASGEIAAGVGRAPPQATSARMKERRTILRAIGFITMRKV